MAMERRFNAYDRPGGAPRWSSLPARPFRRVAMIGTPPGLGLRPTLLVSSPRFQVH